VAIFQEKLAMYQDIFQAILDSAIALDIASGKEECIGDVKSKGRNIGRVATRYAGIIIGLCTGYSIAINRTNNLLAIEELHTKTNIYEVVLINARQDLAIAKLSEETLALLSNRPKNPRRRDKSYDKYVEKRTNEVLNQLNMYFFSNNRH